MITGEYDSLCDKLLAPDTVFSDGLFHLADLNRTLMETAADAIRTLVAERDMYQRRCLEAVRLNDAANSEIEKLRAMRRGKA